MSQIFDTLRRLEEKPDDLPVDLAAEAQAMFHQDAIPVSLSRPTAVAERAGRLEVVDTVDRIEAVETVDRVEVVETVDPADAVEAVDAVQAVAPVEALEAVEREPDLGIPPRPELRLFEQAAQPRKRWVPVMFDASMVVFAMVLFLAIFAATRDLFEISRLILLAVFATLAGLYYLLRVVLNGATPRAADEPRPAVQNAEPAEPEPLMARPIPIVVPAPEDQSSLALVEELVVANSILAKEGVVDAYAHVSVRNDRDPSHYFLAPRRAAELVTAADVSEYDLGNQPVNGGPPLVSSEHFIHGAIYRARPDVMAIAYYHAPELIPFGASTIPLLPVTHLAGFVGEGIPVFEIPAAGPSTNAQPLQFGQALADRLGDKPAALIRGRGAVVVATSLRGAVGRSFYLNMNARLQERAIRLGGNVAYLEASEALTTAPQDGYERDWELWKQKADLSGARRA